MKKKTNEQFVKEIFELVGNEYTILEDYKNSYTKVKMKHNVCGHEWKVMPRDFLYSNSRCPKCAGFIKKTTENFKKEVFDLVGDEYEVLGEYINTNTKIKMRHNKCGHKWWVVPNNFLRGNRCPKCAGKVYNKDTNYFKQEVYELVGDEYSVLGDYKNNKTKIKIKHNTCGNEYCVTPTNFLQGQRCPKCSPELIGLKNTKTNEQFLKEVYVLTGDEYLFLEPYIGNKYPIKVKHNVCGNIYLVKPVNFLQGKRCPICTKKDRLKQKDIEFKQKVYELVGDEYTFLEEYVNSQTKIKIRHNKCGHIYEVTPTSFLNGKNCPYCKASKGEQKIADFLKSMKIRYCTEKTFDDLKDRGFLRFDFYLPIQNICIEYDGEQHYKPVRFNGISEEVAEENFKNRQIKDKLKNNYCKENGINLLRIKYTDFKNIKKILKEVLFNE